MSKPTNIFIFHGTEGHPKENWFPWLRGELEKEGYDVTVPQFPSPLVVAAKISEWFDVLKNYKSKINEETILVGHSLGGKFLLRVLEKLEQPVAMAAFVGTPIGIPPIENNERDNAFTGNEFDWEKIRKMAGRFIVFQSDNDPYVCLDNGKKLAESLGIELNFVPNAGHFNTRAGYTEFPALLEECLK